ncbi:MAG: helix-turn-helix domain-containing protein [Ancrocorticia sp.]|uniref:helix-turn-helix domain-containing protein n=1 Tax=Ancrocorticia sp. TaxID=2593684 RepID=UPI003F8E5203
MNNEFTPEVVEDRMVAVRRDQLRFLRELIVLRKRHGLSQDDVADRLGVSQPAIAALERYDANPTLATLRRYAVAVEARIETAIIDDCEKFHGTHIPGWADWETKTARSNKRWTVSQTRQTFHGAI